MICKRVSLNQKSWLPNGDQAKTLTWRVVSKAIGCISMNTYPICNSLLWRLMWHSYSPSQKSRCHKLSCVWTETISSTISMVVQILCGISAEMPTSGDLKSETVFFSLPPPPHLGISTTPHPRKIDPAPNGNDLGHYDVLHDVHTIKIRNHRFDARNNLCQ